MAGPKVHDTQALTSGNLDQRVRHAAFRFLEEQVTRQGDVLPWSTLSTGFAFEGQRVPLIGPQGIFKPALLDLPLSIATAPPVPGKAKPYDDSVDEKGLLRYRYRGTDPLHRDNVGLRRVMRDHIPLIYLLGVVKGAYVAAWPAFIVGDDPSRLAFSVALEAFRVESMIPPAGQPMLSADVPRRYATVLTLQRLHQTSFRERVLRAYQQTCAVCRLRHAELLEAAHILPDGHPRGVPEVFNGLALCKLHHAAFDQNIIGIRPDLVIEVRPDVLDEEDGPMLVHGIQEFHRQHLQVPRSAEQRPNPGFLSERFDAFKKAG